MAYNSTKKQTGKPAESGTRFVPALQERVMANLDRFAGRIPGTVIELDKEHALVKLDKPFDPFGHEVYVNFKDLEPCRG